VLTLDRLWPLTRSWYANRLDYDWRPRTPEAVEQLFAQGGLREDFWRIR
jgi:hypothetical protein